MTKEELLQRAFKRCVYLDKKNNIDKNIIRLKNELSNLEDELQRLDSRLGRWYNNLPATKEDVSLAIEICKSTGMDISSDDIVEYFDFNDEFYEIEAEISAETRKETD